MSEFYNFNRLLSMNDLDGKRPEWYLVSGNKSAGKTTDACRLLINRFLKYNEEFMIVYRWVYELQSAGELLESIVNPLYWDKIRFMTKPIARGLFYKIFLGFETEVDGETIIEKWQLCGYSVALNNVDSLKKYSNYFQKVTSRFMDEFQAENNHYCKDEMSKWQTLQILSSRGIGCPYRYTRTLLCSNSYSLLNPYFLKFGIHKRLTKDTKILRGHGWVMEQCYNEHASKIMKQSSLLESLSSANELDYATENKYLDNTCFIQKPHGKSTYIMTLIRNGKSYGVRDYDTYYHVSSKSQECINTFAFSVNDHGETTDFIAHNSFIYMALINMFRKGKLRFESVEEKELVLDLLSL